MNSPQRHTAVVLVGMSAMGTAHLSAQSIPAWSTFNPQVTTWGLALWDEDGPGPTRPFLVASQIVSPLPSGQPTYIAKYDGRAWRPIGEPLWGQTFNTSVRAMVASETSGVGSPAPGLYAAGRFLELTGGEPAESLAHWDGTKWNAFPGRASGHGKSLLMFDEDAEGPAEPNLFIGGVFFDVNGIAEPGLVRWDGSEFSILGGGLTMRLTQTTPTVSAMIEWDNDGPGPNKPALYVGGGFDFADGQPAGGVARWTGTQWETLGQGLNGGILDFAVFDPDGSGPQPASLYAGGGFVARDPQGNYIITFARFDGTNWVSVPGWNGGGIESLEVFDDDGDGPGEPVLIISGLFNSINGVPASAIVKWDGQNWEAMAGGLTGIAWSSATDLQTFDEDDDPSTPAGLYVGGTFTWVDGIWSPGHGRWGMPNPICLADCDESTGLGRLDLFDFLCFQSNFVLGDPYACNCDVSTGINVCDIFDFLCFQNAFVAGCH